MYCNLTFCVSRTRNSSRFCRVLTYFVKNKYTNTKTRNSTTKRSERPKILSPQF